MFFHAHVYFDKEQESIAKELHSSLKKKFSDVRLSKMHDQPVGPHTKPMFQMPFHSTDLEEIYTWIICNHKGLSVLIHPCLEEDLLDHTERAAWLGEKVPLDLDKL